MKLTAAELEAVAISCALGNNGGEWATHYSEDQKNFWRQFVRDVFSAIDEDNEIMRDALVKIAQWSDAYPLDIFPEPDFVKAAALLKANGMTLDAISASCMRHVVEGVGGIAKQALKEIAP